MFHSFVHIILFFLQRRDNLLQLFINDTIILKMRKQQSLRNLLRERENK